MMHEVLYASIIIQIYFIWCLTYIQAFTRSLIFATQVLTKLVRPLYIVYVLETKVNSIHPIAISED